VIHVGKSFLFDYGDLVVQMRYPTGTRLEWEQVKGPQVGLKAEREYGHSIVRSDIIFFWWEEKDLAIVTQVVDFGKGSVHTTWISSDRKPAGFRGAVRALG
jgi:MoaF-like